MLFNTLDFVFFMLVVYGLYRSLPHRGQNWMLLVASYFFYGCWNWKFLGLLWLSTVVDYLCGARIAASERPGARKAWLTLSMVTNLGILGVFKYFNFFAENLIALAEVVGLHLNPVSLQVILPVGISFYTFQTMSYTIDIYRREMEPCRRFDDFALYVSFFPQLVAGPIERASRLIPQLVHPRTVWSEDLAEGAWLIFWGFFKKIFIADTMALIVNDVFARSDTAGGLEIVIAVYAFAFQIYGDFSGYSDIAIGVSRLMGVRLMTNFRFPYFVTNPRDFWQHWHISLSTWLRDYLYIPLGGSKGGAWKTYRNLAVTMFLGGLWHGAGWPFLIWGIYQGVFLALHRAMSPWLDRVVPQGLRKGVGRLILVLLMFQATALGWLFFRAQSGAQIVELLTGIATRLSVAPERALYFALLLVFHTWLLLLVQWLQWRRNDLLVMLGWPLWQRWALIFVAYLMMMLWGNFGGQEFIYFQF